MWYIIGDLLSIALWLGLVAVLCVRNHKRGDNDVQFRATAKPQQTNADRIRAMSDEDLCLFLNCRTPCDSCAFNDVCTTPYSAEACVTGVMKWLQQPAARPTAAEDKRGHSGLSEEA